MKTWPIGRPHRHRRRANRVMLAIACALIIAGPAVTLTATAGGAKDHAAQPAAPVHRQPSTVTESTAGLPFSGDDLIYLGATAAVLLALGAGLFLAGTAASRRTSAGAGRC